MSEHRGVPAPSTSGLVGAVDAVAAGQERWRGGRRSLNRRRSELARAAARLYRPELRVADLTLAPPEWVPRAPVPLADVRLEWTDAPPVPDVTGGEPEADAVLPLRAAGRRFARYTAAMRDLDPPALFENRPCYRLLAVDLASRPSLTFGLAAYFEKLDVDEAVAHELAVATPGSDPPSWEALPLRALVGDPFDLRRRAVVPGISTLTVRHDRRDGTATFLLHWRDASKVATGGGTYGLIPMGEFQPSTPAPHDRANDFDLWRNMVREYSEELLGEPERDGRSGAPLDYANWDLYRRLEEARTAGRVRPYFLGVAMNALTLAATVLTVTVVDAEVFDDVFAGAVTANEEGTLVSTPGAADATRGVPFDHDTVMRFLHDEPVGSTTAAILRRVWELRDQLL